MEVAARYSGSTDETAARDQFTPQALVRLWPLALGLVAFSGVSVLLTMETLRLTGGHFGYYLDDAYIHMAIAKNFSQHGVWGVTPYEFSSSSSSLLWTLVLSLSFLVTGPLETVPALINVGISLAILACLYQMLRAEQVGGIVIVVVLLLAVFLVPLPEMVFTGMEHSLHVLLSLLFVFVAARVLASEPQRSTPWALVALAPLISAVRYEGLFLLAAVCGCLLLRRFWRTAVLVGAAGLFAPVAYGLISVLNGWYLLPNSVLLKGEVPGASATGEMLRAFIFRGVYAQVSDAPYLILLVGLALGLVVLGVLRSRWPWNPAIWALALFALTAVLHMQFVASRWFNRYDAYLVAMGLFVIGLAVVTLLPIIWPKTRPGLHRSRALALGVPLVGVVAAVVLATGGGHSLTQRVYGVSELVERARTGITIVPIGAKNNYEQHYQMGLFLQRHYPGAVVALNDIGAPTYLADIRLVDLVGLGSQDVAERRRAGQGRITKSDVDELTTNNGVQIAIVFRNLLYGDDELRIPDHWIEVGDWGLKDNVVAGDDSVFFYAVDEQEQERLFQSLRAFAGVLPPDVHQGGMYVWAQR